MWEQDIERLRMLHHKEAGGILFYTKEKPNKEKLQRKKTKDWSEVVGY